MKRCADDRRKNPAAYMPWRPGGCTTERDGLCFAERRPADMSRTRRRGGQPSFYRPSCPCRGWCSIPSSSCRVRRGVAPPAL